MPDYMEWVGEGMDPGGRGAVTIRWGLPERRSLAPTLTYAIVAAVGLGWGIFLAITKQDVVDVPIVLAVIGGYLVVGYMIRPEADRTNLGWGGGLFDNPFRWSDDLNRWLLFLMLALWPGRFIMEGLMGAVSYPFRSKAGSDGDGEEDLGPELMK